MGLLIAAVLSLGLGILALVGLLALAREFIVDRSFEPGSTDDEGAAGTGDVGRASGRRCVTIP
jgi:hypothetical protein